MSRDNPPKGKTRFRNLNFATMAMRRHRRVMMSFVLWTHSGGIMKEAKSMDGTIFI